jgi:hypothetical protein
VDGGMIAGIRANCAVHDQSLMAFSGLDAIRNALQELAASPADGPFFLELLACPGGCVNGPGVQAPVATVAKRRRVLAAAPYAPAEIPRPLSVALELDRRLPALPERAGPLPENELRPVLASIGKYVAGDELNCGGCGYGNCREFASALLAGHAERTMCVSYMRKLAQKKANALIRAMPSGVVIVDDQMRVVECNARFVRLLGDDAVLAYDAKPGLEGVQIAKLAPFLVRFFERVMGGGDDLIGRTVRGGGRVYRFSLFGIEARRIAGCVLQDVTEPAVQKEQVVREAREVIRKNLATVQKIAYLLGENAAESQATLNAIIESFSATALTGAPAAELTAPGGEETDGD